MDEAVSRATEMGRPVHYTLGGGTDIGGGLATAVGPMIVAGLSVLSFVARLTCKYNTPLIVTLGSPDVLPLTEEIVSQAYLEGGKQSAGNASIRYIPSTSFNGGVQGIIRRERPAANICIGPFYHEIIIFAENATRVGAITIAGTARLLQIPFMIATCDFTLIGEEIYAAGAYLSRDPVLLASLAGQDMGKLVSTFLLAAVAILATFKIDLLVKLLKT